MLDFRLDTFLEVCRWMNFTKAAQALHITQPAVSQHIRYLEQLYGVRLFDYQGKRPVLTEAGQTLLSAATTMKHDTLVLQERMQTLGKGSRSLLLGVTLTIGDFVAPVPLAHYLRQNPEADVRLSVANTHELLRRLDAGEIDFAIVEGFFEKREYESLPFSREAYLAVCGVQHPIPEAPCQMEDLLGERLLLREPGSGTREILERFLEGRNLTVRDFRRTAQVAVCMRSKRLCGRAAASHFSMKRPYGRSWRRACCGGSRSRDSRFPMILPFYGGGEVCSRRNTALFLSSCNRLQPARLRAKRQLAQQASRFRPAPTA